MLGVCIFIISDCEVAIMTLRRSEFLTYSYKFVFKSCLAAEKGGGSRDDLA